MTKQVQGKRAIRSFLGAAGEENEEGGISVIVTLVWTTAGSTCIIAERQRTGEPTNTGGVHDASGGEESGNKKLQLEHGDVGGVSAGRLASSKGTYPRFYIFPPSPMSASNLVI